MESVQSDGSDAAHGTKKILKPGNFVHRLQFLLQLQVTVQMPAMRRAAVAFYTRGDNIWNQQISIQFEYT
jgi:hypothetical protein